MTVAEVESERQGRRRRLIIILVVAGVLFAALMTFGIVRDYSINDRTEAAIAEIQAKWRPLDLNAMADAHSDAAFKCVSTAECTSLDEILPAVSHTRISDAQFETAGTVRANYFVHGWASNQCLSVVAQGPAPNKVTITRGASGADHSRELPIGTRRGVQADQCKR